MKLYIWTNEDTDYFGDANCSRYDDFEPKKSPFGFHSGAIIVVADTKEEAVELLSKYERERVQGFAPIEKEITKGVIFSEFGEC